MQRKFVSRTPGNRRLVLVYADWGMDWHPLRSLRLAGYDIAVVWDYRDLGLRLRSFNAYDEICLVAWGVGVFAASLTVHELLGRITRRIAVNGTLDPVDDARGMSTALFQSLVNTLSPGTLRRFQTRMCTSSEQFDLFFANRPQRTLADLREELAEIETHTIFHAPQTTDWDLAVISRDDVIFSTQNQVRAWRDLAPIQFLESGHLPDFNALLPRLVLDKDRIAMLAGQPNTSAESDPCQSAGAVIDARMARQLLDRFTYISGFVDSGVAAEPTPGNGPLVGNILEIGCGTGTLKDLYTPLRGDRSRLLLWDLVGQGIPTGPDTRFTACDAEVGIRRIPSESVNILFSLNTIHWFNSPAGFLRQIERVLIPGGYAVISSYTDGTLAPLTRIAGHPLHLPPTAAWRRMVPDTLDVLVCESPYESLPATPVSPVVTYRPLYLILRKPDL